MIALTAREALDPRVARVTTTMRPVELAEPARRMGLYAVFDDESGRFLRLVPAQDATPFPHRIFADLLPKSPPAPVVADAPLDAVSDRMATEGVEALPVLDDRGAFLGVITRMSLLEALLRRERELLAEAHRLEERLGVEQKRLVAWSKRLEELNQAGRSLLSLVAWSPVEQKVLQEGLQALVTLLQARYGAIGITDQAGGLQQFLFTGLAAEEADRIGELPQGRGLLGVVIRENQVLRLADLTQDPRYAGFPANHPPLKSLLAVPISHQGQVYGRVYLCDKTTSEPFTEDDEQMALSFARSLALVFAHVREQAERRGAEEACQLAEADMRQLMASISDYVWSADLSQDGHAVYRYLSPVVQKITGYPPEFFVPGPERWLSTIHPEDKPRLHATLERILAGGSWRKEDEHRIIRPDGSIRWVRDSVTTRQLEDGRIRLDGVVSDITARKQAEEALRASEERYRTLVETSPDSIVLADLNGNIVMTNWQGLALIGYASQEEVVGKNILNFVGLEDRPRAAEDFRRILEAGDVRGSQYTMLKKGGTPFPADLSGSVFVDAAGKPMGFIGVARDITERKQAEDALREMNVALENAMPGISRLDSEGRYISVNEVYARMLGYEPSEMIGADWKPMVHPEDREHAIVAYERMLREGKAESEARAVRKDGSVFHKHVLMVRSVDKEGGFIGHHCFMRDITERKQAEETLHALYRASLAIQEPLGLLERLALLLQTARDVIHLDRLNILLADPEGRWLEGVATLGTKEPPEAMRVPIAPEGGGIAQAYLSQQPIVWWDSQAPVPEEIRLQPPYNRLEAFRSRAFAILPLVTQGRAIGVLGADRKHSRRPLESATLKLLQLFADQAAIAIENARVHEGAVQRAQQLAMLNELTRTLTTALDPQRVAQKILEAIQVLIPGAVGSLWEQGAGGEMLRLVANIGLPAPKGGTLELAPGVGLIGIAASTRQPVISQNVPGDPRFHDPAWAAGEGLVSSIVLPLLLGERVIGGLAIFTREPHRFTDDEVTLLQSFAAQAAIALENARLFEEVRNGRERLQSLSHRLVEVQEAERRHIARELHDEIGQALTAIKINLQAMQRLGDSRPLLLHLGEGIGIVERTIEQVRTLSFDLRPSVLDDLGLVAALRWVVDRQAQRAGFEAQCVADPPGLRAPPDIETACFRVAQEALTNVMRHAQARRVRVEVRQCGATLELLIHDDGVGFDAGAIQERAAHGASFGLLGMQERVRLVGGQIELESTPTGGTTIRARFPLR